MHLRSLPVQFWSTCVTLTHVDAGLNACLNRKTNNYKPMHCCVTQFGLLQEVKVVTDWYPPPLGFFVATCTYCWDSSVQHILYSAGCCWHHFKYLLPSHIPSHRGDYMGGALPHLFIYQINSSLIHLWILAAILLLKSVWFVFIFTLHANDHVFFF